MSRIFPIKEEKLLRHFSRYLKTAKYFFLPPAKNTEPVFILGCGRSGTTMMINIFHRDLRVESLDENSPKVAEDFMLIPERLEVALRLSRAPILIAKPILHSFYASQLLDMHKEAKIIWMLRSYKDMIASTIKKFGVTVPYYMKDIIVKGQGSNWLSSSLPLVTKSQIVQIACEEFTPADWTGLIWWSVNRTVIIDQLLTNERFRLVTYESLVQHPEQVLSSIYEFLGLNYHPTAAKYIHPSSIGKGKKVKLHPTVQRLCEDLSVILNSTPVSGQNYEQPNSLYNSQVSWSND